MYQKVTFLPNGKDLEVRLCASFRVHVKIEVRELAMETYFPRHLQASSFVKKEVSINDTMKYDKYVLLL